MPQTDERRIGVPRPRYGTADEIAATIAFLASDGVRRRLADAKCMIVSMQTDSETLFAHVRDRKSELATQTDGLFKIYLDTNFWIWLERAANGKPDHPSHFELLGKLRDGVKRSKIICPITENTILELVLRHAKDRRHKSIALLDELSGRISLLPQIERLELEIESLLPWGSSRPLVWVKSAYLFGETHPVPNPEFFEPEQQLEIQKRFFDHRWGLPLSSFLAHAIEEYDERPTLRESAKEIGAANLSHADEGSSFEDFLKYERIGVAEHLAAIGLSNIRNFSQSVVANQKSPSEEAQAHWTGLFLKALQIPEGRRKLLSAHVISCLHAARRANKTQKTHANDYYDFEHATAALVYCDAFFCEGGLNAAIDRTALSNRDEVKCQVTSDASHAIKIVEKQL